MRTSSDRPRAGRSYCKDEIGGQKDTVWEETGEPLIFVANRSDLDQEWAHRKFAGKSNDEMQQYFRNNLVETASDLRFMPEMPFRY